MKSHPIPSDPHSDINFSDDVEQVGATRSNSRPLLAYLFIMLLSWVAVGIVLLLFRGSSTLEITPTARPIVSVTPTWTPDPTQTQGAMVVWTQTPTPTATPTITPSPAPTATRWPQPAWMSIKCLEKIQRLMQQELRGSLNNDAYKFMATQLLYRALEADACVFKGWTGGAIGVIPPIVSANLNAVLYDLPTMGYPYCGFVVSWQGVQVLLDRRYDKPDTKVLMPGLDEYGPRGLAIGVNCTPG